MEPGEVLRDEAHTVGEKDAVCEKRGPPFHQRLLNPPTIPHMQCAITKVVGEMCIQMCGQWPGADHSQRCISQENGRDFDGDREKTV